MNGDRKFRWVGTRPIRHDGVDKVTGRANFGADLAFPDMLWGRVLRSPHAHARIRRIDVTKALALPGVKAVATAADLPELASKEAAGGEGAMNFRDLSRNILARDKVLYHGHAVAAVAATTPDAAEQALAAIEVTYEPLPPVLSIDAALAPGAPVLHADLTTRGADASIPNVASRIVFERGDPAAGFAAADVEIGRASCRERV